MVLKGEKEWLRNTHMFGAYNSTPFLHESSHIWEWRWSGAHSSHTHRGLSIKLKWEACHGSLTFQVSHCRSRLVSWSDQVESSAALIKDMESCGNTTLLGTRATHTQHHTCATSFHTKVGFKSHHQLNVSVCTSESPRQNKIRRFDVGQIAPQTEPNPRLRGIGPKSDLSIV